MSRLYAYAIGAVLTVALGLFAYRAIQQSGADAERLVCDAEWAPKVERLQSEKLAAQQAVIAAQQAKAAAESALAKQLEEQADEYTKRIASLEAGNAGARRELARLRDALATARVSLRSLSQSETARAGPAPDGSSADTGELLGECAGRLVEMGGQADRLAAQVIGLQAYARIAHRACGS